MFTGIIEEVGIVNKLSGGKLSINANKVVSDVQLGDSIAVNGVCLTVTAFSKAGFVADVMPETIRRTSLTDLKNGSAVNLERALTLASRLGGHIVSGHIDGVGTVASFKQEGNAVLLTINATTDLLRYIVVKGSVALDGISLTVAQVTETAFTVSLIPHTREVTNLKYKQVGDFINIETDVIGKYVEKLLTGQNANKAQNSKISQQFLLENGF